VYGTSPAGFTACWRTAFFGAFGPVGMCGSCVGGVVAAVGSVGGGVFPVCAPGEDENLEDMLDNHEFRLDGPGDGALGPPFIVCVFSVELLLENDGRCGRCIVFGDVGGASFGC
jgi:hypothetical protein